VDDGPEEVLAALDPEQRDVALAARGPVALHRAAVFRVAHVVLDGRLALGGGVLGPDALRAAEVGDARLGRDPRPREHDDLPGPAQQIGETVEGFDVGHGATLRAREQRVPGTGTRRSAAGARRGRSGAA